MKRIMIVLLSFALAGGGITIKADAASGSHSATHCTQEAETTCVGTLQHDGDGDYYCLVFLDDYNIRLSECGGLMTYEEDPTYDKNDELISTWYWSTCNKCNRTYYDNTYYEYCHFSYCETYRDYDGSYPGYVFDHEHKKCKHGEFHINYDKWGDRVWTCLHGERGEHTVLEYQDCSSSNPCSKPSHSSVKTKDHYYCTTHNYLGTSPTCPGLTVSPSPSSMSLCVGQTKAISASEQPSSASVSFYSNNSSIASVTSYGTVRGNKRGSTSVTVTATL